MLKRQIIIVFISLLMALLTYQLPFMTGQEIVIKDETMISAGDTGYSDVQKAEIDRLLKKKSLTEEEFQLLKKYTDKNTKKIIESSKAENIDMYSQSTYSKIRKSTLFWLFLIWGIFFAFIPISWLEFVEATVLPIIFGISGLILKLELTIIVILAVIAYVIKKYFIPKKQIEKSDASQ